MNAEFEEDFARWERDEISFDELAASHREMRDLQRLRDQLTSLAEVPTPSAGSGWEALRRRLPTPRPTPLAGAVRWVHRPAVAAAAAVLLTAGVVLAVEPVGRGAKSFLSQVAGFIGQGVTSLLDLPTPPAAHDVSLSGTEDLVRSWVPAVNGEDGEELTCRIASSAGHGTADVRSDCANGSYIPDPDFYGPDVFTYTVSDEDGLSAAAVVKVTLRGVNDPPVAVNDQAVTNEDLPATIHLFANDSDVDGASPSRIQQSRVGPGTNRKELLLRSVFGTNGTVGSREDGTLTYAPPPNFNGVDSFRYVAWDGSNGFDVATVSVRVRPVNDVPIAADVSAGGDEDVAVEWVPSVDDVEDDSLTCSVGTPAAHGEVDVNHHCSGGTFTPDPDFNGTDSFTYLVSDGTDESTPATVTLTVDPVNDVPVAADVSAGGDEDVAVEWVPSVDDVEDDSLTCSVGTPAAHGEVDVNHHCSGGTFTPDPDFNGTDSFTYLVSDGTDESTPATVTLTVDPVNDVPVAADDAVTTVEDTPILVSGLANDTDVDGDSLFVESVGSGAHGTVTNNGDGTFTYTPDVDFVGSDSFTYVVSDGNGGSDTAQVTLSVTPGLESPATHVDEQEADPAG